MARKQSGRAPHKVGDRPGLKWIHGKGTDRIKIGDIEVLICHEAGQTVSYTVAPKDVKIVVESENDLQKVGKA
jgi:hypothetical protein